MTQTDKVDFSNGRHGPGHLLPRPDTDIRRRSGVPCRHLPDVVSLTVLLVSPYWRQLAADPDTRHRFYAGAGWRTRRDRRYRPMHNDTLHEWADVLTAEQHIDDDICQVYCAAREYGGSVEQQEIRVTDSPGGSNRTLFTGTAWHYARYRPGYPSMFFTDLVARFRLDGTGRLLDLGCGTGQLTLRLAEHVAAAIGIDPEPEMLTEAARQAQAAGVGNVTWAQGSSADLPGELGHFDLVTMGRSFHWMDREQVLTALDGMVDNDGGLVIANDSCLIRSATTWQQAIEDIQQRFLPPDWQTGIPTCADGHEPHEEMLARSAFRHVQQRAYQFTRTWTIEQAIGYLYSTSMPLHRLLGSRRAAFEQEVTDTLLAIDPAGRFTEPVTLEVLTATKR